MPSAAVIRQFTRARRGTAAIEFAFALIPLVLILSAGITYSGVFAMQLALTHAANEGARAALAGLSQCERGALAAEGTRDALTLGQRGSAQVTAEVTAGEVRVTIRYPYAAAALLPVLLPVPNMLEATAMSRTDGAVLPDEGC